MSTIRAALLVVAAGRGLRFGATRPKQYLNCAGRPLIAHTLEALTVAWPFSAVKVVIHADDRALYDEALAHLAAAATAALGPPAIGGATRQQSVLAGLEALAPAQADIVLIHDAARPFPSPELVARAVQAAISHGAAAPGTPISDTVKQVDPRGPGARDPAPLGLARRADAAGVRLSPHPGGASARGGRRRRRSHRRHCGRRMGGRAGLCVRRRSRQPQGDDHAGYERRRGAAHGKRERDAGRPGFRRPRLRARRPCLAVRRQAFPIPRR